MSCIALHCFALWSSLSLPLHCYPPCLCLCTVLPCASTLFGFALPCIFFASPCLCLCFVWLSPLVGSIALLVSCLHMGSPSHSVLFGLAQALDWSRYLPWYAVPCGAILHPAVNVLFCLAPGLVNFLALLGLPWPAPHWLPYLPIHNIPESRTILFIGFSDGSRTLKGCVSTAFKSNMLCNTHSGTLWTNIFHTFVSVLVCFSGCWFRHIQWTKQNQTTTIPTQWFRGLSITPTTIQCACFQSIPQCYTNVQCPQ